MNTADLKEKISAYVLKNEEEMVEYLKSLIRLPSPQGKPTYPQELVAQTMRELGLSVEAFPGDLENTKKYPDYCPLPEQENNSKALNLVSVKKGEKAPSLMLFSHVDTELPLEKIWGDLDPFDPWEKEGKVWGLGAADAKSGLAMILMALKAIFAVIPGELPGDLVVMSVLGKRGGAAGALTAIHRGYRADAAIYCHSAETQHGFQEIKNYSMGTMDFKVLVKGKEGVPYEDLDDSEINAIKKGKEVLEALLQWDGDRREKMIFPDGNFVGQAMTKLHPGRLIAGDYVGKDPLEFELQCRLYFPLGETVDGLLGEIEKYLVERFASDSWFAENPPRVKPMFIRANPAETSSKDPLIRIVEENINLVKGPQEFIYQHHGASDIRFPILYLGIPAVGIGSLAGGFSGVEWIDREDFLKGVEILAFTILDWWAQAEK